MSSAFGRQPPALALRSGSGCKSEEGSGSAANSQTFLSDAAAIVAAIGDPDVSARWYERDPMIAIEHMALAAAALGYGTCWIGAPDEDAVKHLLKIPARMRVIALLPIGIPDEAPAPRPRKKLSEIFFKEEWQTS